MGNFYRGVEILVREILEATGQEDTDINCSSIVEQLNGYIQTVKDAGILYQYEIYNTGKYSFVIEFHSAEPTNRNIAKAIADLFLDGGYVINEEKWNKVSTLHNINTSFNSEYFARALLMPEIAFRKAYAKIKSLSDVARIFDVSQEDALIRAIDLNVKQEEE